MLFRSRPVVRHDDAIHMGVHRSVCVIMIDCLNALEYDGGSSVHRDVTVLFYSFGIDTTSISPSPPGIVIAPARAGGALPWKPRIHVPTYIMYED